MNRILSSCLLFMLSAAAAANEATTSPGTLAPVDSQAIRYEAFQALAAAGNLLDEHEAPLASRVNLYVSQAGLSKRRLRQVRFIVDDGQATAFDLTETEAGAIAEYDELRRVTRLSLPSGAHNLRAEFSVMAPGKSSDAPSVVTSDYKFEKADGTLDLEFRLDPGAILGAKIRTRQWQRNNEPARKVLGVAVDRVNLPGASQLQYRSGSAADPALSNAQHLARVGQTDVALIELLKMGAASDDVAQAAEFQLEAAHTLRSLGLLDRAEALCDQLDQQHALSERVATERLQLAIARYSGGELDQAERQLRLAQTSLPELRRADWRYAEGMVLIARQRPADAAAVLGESSTDTIDAYRYMNASTESLRSTAYNRFNLAVAMVQSGDETRGLSWLDLIGRSAPSDPEMLALRDQANLALGWHFLQAKQGRTALGVLGRVRGEGLLSDRALLGMGWAQLAPNGERLPRVQLATDPPRAPDQISDLPAPLKNSLTRLRVLEPELHGVIGPRSFEREDPPKNREAGLHRALNVWSVLLQRDEREPAVLEAMLATAYAYDQLRDQNAARAAYATAVAALHRVETEIGSEKDFVRDGRLSSAVADSLDDDALFQLMDRLHLPPVEATAPLYGALQQNRDYGRLQAALTRMQARIAGITDPSAQPVITQLDASSALIAEQRNVLGKNIATLALSNLEARRVNVRTYLKSALLLAARVEDQPALDGRIGKP